MGLFLLGFTCRLPHTAIYRAFVRGYSNFSNCFGQMLSILQCSHLMTICPRFTNNFCNRRTNGCFIYLIHSYLRPIYSQSLSYLQFIRHIENNYTPSSLFFYLIFSLYCIIFYNFVARSSK